MRPSVMRPGGRREREAAVIVAERRTGSPTRRAVTGSDERFAVIGESYEESPHRSQSAAAIGERSRL